MDTLYIKSYHFPVEALKGQIKDLFSDLEAKDFYIDAEYNGLQKYLRYIQSDLPVANGGCLSSYEGGKYSIELYDNFCQFVWLIGYTLLVYNDCGLIITTNKDSLVSVTRAKNLVDQADEIYKESLKMLERNPNDAQYMAASRGKLLSFPSAGGLNRNEYTDKADAMAVYGITYVLAHEFGHFILQHDESTKTNESAADKYAFEKIKSWSAKSGQEFTALIGILSCLIACAYINTNLVSSTHPDLDKRVLNALSVFQDSLKDEQYQSLYQLLVLGVNLWGVYAGLEIPAPKDFSKLKEYLCNDIMAIIEDHKKQYRI